MEQIKKILHLYRLDWKRIFKSPMATLLIVALMILPSLYAWFNIKALWDPYSNTGELPIAIYSGDKGTTFQGKEVAIGEEVIKTLHKNKQLGWRFVSSKHAVTEGVKSGKYYAGIYLPKDFSQDLLSFISGDIDKPKIEYYINEKINAIAPKITDKGATSLQDQITENFIKTASSTLMKVFNEIGYDLDSNLLSINKVKNLILETDENIATIDGYAKQVVELNEKMPAIKEKIAKAQEFADYLPQVDAMGKKLIALNEKMPELKKQAAIIMTLQEKIPEIENAGKQLASVDQDFASIEKTMTDGIAEAKQGLTIIQDVQKVLPDIKQLGSQANNLASTTENAAKQMEQALPSISQSVKVNLDLIAGLSSNIYQWTAALQKILNQDGELTEQERAAIKKILQEISTTLADQQQTISKMIDWLQQLATELDGDFSNVIGHLTTLKTAIAGLQRINDDLLAGIDTINKDDLRNFISQLNQLAGNVRDFANSVPVDEITSKIEMVLKQQLIPALQNAEGLLAKANKIDFDALLSATSQTVANAITLLEKYQKQMPAIKQEVHDANVMLNEHLPEIVSGINKGVELYQNELPVVEEKLQLATDFLQKDWSGIKTEISSTFKMVDEKLPAVESALTMASELIEKDWPSLKAGLHKAADAIRKGEKEVDLGDVIKLLKLDAQKESDFLTKPVELKTKQYYPIANNGSASTPFYTALCLWVGALLLASLATTDYHLEGKDKKKYSQRQTFLARMLTFLTMAVFQALVVTLGNYFLLGVDVRAPLFSVLFALIIGLTFMMIVYVLSALFGNIGKGIAIIILVLSISGGGGNYPIQVSGKFFQFINPLLPFTHAVNLLRESAGGIYWANAWPDILILSGFCLFFGIVGTVFYPKIITLTKRLSKVSAESHFFH